jgi:hypothetical protein
VPRSRRVAQGDRVAESAATTVPGVNDA